MILVVWATAEPLEPEFEFPFEAAPDPAFAPVLADELAELAELTVGVWNDWNPLAKLELADVPLARLPVSRSPWKLPPEAPEPPADSRNP